MKETETDHVVRPSGFVGMARVGMTISIITSMLVILFYSVLSPMLPARTDASWPRAIIYLAYALLAAVTAGFLLSGFSLTGITRYGRKGILGPGLTGILLSIFLGIPFCSLFMSHQARQARMTSQPAASTSPQTASASIQISTQPSSVSIRISSQSSAAEARQGTGTFIPAPDRVDMVYDPKRNLLYITDSGSVLRYQVASNAFLSPLNLGGNLRGIDLSMDDNTLAVADGDGHTGRIGIYLVDLKTGGSSRCTFPAESLESGAYAVAFDAEGAVWVTTSMNGSGFVPLRKWDPVAHHGLQIGTVSQDTMLAASADRQTIAFAEANNSAGEYGRISCRATQFPRSPLRASAFLYEIGVNRDGSLLAVPTYQNVVLSGASVPQIDEPAVIGATCDPHKDYVYLTCGGSSIVAVYNTKTGAKVKELDLGDRFDWTGNHAFQSGRLRLSADGAWLFCTVGGGIRCVATGLN